MEENESKESSMKVRSKKKSGAPSHDCVDQQSSQDTKVHSSKSGVADLGISSLEGDSAPIDGTMELAKKRLASRVSSRRTREREKLRMDHFRSAKVKLLDANKKLADENQKLRSLIHKYRVEKAIREQNQGGAIASIFSSNNQVIPATRNVFTPVLPPASQQHGQPDLSSLLMNALAQNMAQQQQQAPLGPSQDQQLMALLGLVANNPGAHSVGQLHQSQQQPAAAFSQLVAQMQHNQQQPSAAISQLVAQIQHSQQQQHPPMNRVGAMQGNVNFGTLSALTTNHPSQNLQHSNNLLSLLMNKNTETNR